MTTRIFYCTGCRHGSDRHWPMYSPPDYKGRVCTTVSGRPIIRFCNHANKCTCVGVYEMVDKKELRA